MSKIGTLNFELQEQAETLGYSTTQEALDSGWDVDYFSHKLVKKNNIDELERQLAELEWEQEKNSRTMESLKSKIKELKGYNNE